MPAVKSPADNKAANQKAYFLVIEYIKTLMAKGEITFGGRLPSERQLMATLGLGRNSVREALRTLENTGILESRHGQGSFLVNHIGASLGSTFSLLLSMNECSVPEISQLRRSIEIGACLLAVRQTPEAGTERLTALLQDMEKSSLEERASLDKAFHDTLIALSGNRLLKLLNETLSDLFETTIQDLLSHISAREWDTLLTYHTRICACLLAKDEASCIAAVMEHYDFIDAHCMT